MDEHVTFAARSPGYDREMRVLRLGLAKENWRFVESGIRRVFKHMIWCWFLPPVDCVDCRCITEYLPDLVRPTLYPSSTWTAITTHHKWRVVPGSPGVVCCLLSRSFYLLLAMDITSTRGKSRVSITTHVRERAYLDLARRSF